MAERKAVSNTVVNPLAPGMSHDLSPEVAKGIAELKHSGEMSAYATRDEAAIRRQVLDRDEATLHRPVFVRDAEKIMHMPSYNRLAGKTMAFTFNANDDITRRGLHVQLVNRVARDIGAALGLNLDLIDAIALGHDIGHTPFGHAGERFLNAIYHERTGRTFFHNVNSVRVLDVLYGRNLTLQTLDGIICHNGEFEKQVIETSNLDNFADFDRAVEECWQLGEQRINALRPMTLEGAVVRVSDIIAYVGKDRQDALRDHLVEPEDFDDGLGSAYNTWALSAFITDVIENSFGKDRIEMSEEGFAEMSRAKAENYEKIYRVTEINGERANKIGELFRELYLRLYSDLENEDRRSPIFKHHIDELNDFLAHLGKSYDWQSDLDLCVVDYIASMTDNYFMMLCERCLGDQPELFALRNYFDKIEPDW